MWQQNYAPVAGSAFWSTLVAALPIIVLLYMLGVRRRSGWVSGLCGLAMALGVAWLAYGMPLKLALSSSLMGMAFGLFPIGWILFSAMYLYQIAQRGGRFQLLRNSIGWLTNDRRLQALLIAFAFGALLEGAAGFGSPVAIAGAMLAALGFDPVQAAVLCLVANTAPVAFGSIGIPIYTLAGTTSLPLQELSAQVGRLCAPVSLLIPSYMMLLYSGWPGLRSVWPASLGCGGAFALVQFASANFLGPELTDVLSSLAAFGSLILICRLWKPAPHPTYTVSASLSAGQKSASRRELFLAWLPYVLLIGMVMLWSLHSVKTGLETATLRWAWPGLHQSITRQPPISAQAEPIAAIFQLNLLSAAGTACLLASLLAGLFLRVPPAQMVQSIGVTLRQLWKPLVTIAAVLGLAFVMNYSGATATLGLAMAATGRLFPFFSPLLGWLGVFLTGSDTSANALFGNLQVVSAQQLGLDPVLMAAANSSGGVVGKMISLQSIAVAVAAAGATQAGQESRLFRSTLPHSLLLAGLFGLLTLLYSAWP